MRHVNKDVALYRVRVHSLAICYVRPYIDALRAWLLQSTQSPISSLDTTEHKGNTIEATRISKDARNSETPAPSTHSSK